MIHSQLITADHSHLLQTDGLSFRVVCLETAKVTHIGTLFAKAARFGQSSLKRPQHGQAWLRATEARGVGLVTQPLSQTQPYTVASAYAGTRSTAVEPNWWLHGTAWHSWVMPEAKSCRRYCVQHSLP